MKRRIRPFPLALLIVILALVGCFIGFTLKTQQVNANFHYNAAYEDLNLNRPKAVFQRLSEDGYDLTVPGLSGPVTFTSPCNFSFFQDFKEHDVKKGDTITFDFVTYSRGYVYTAARSGVFTVNGHEYATMLPLRAPSLCISRRWSRTVSPINLKRTSARPCPSKPPTKRCESWTGSSTKPGSTIPRTIPLTRCSGI